MQGCSLALASTIAVTRAASCHVNSQTPTSAPTIAMGALHSAQRLTDTPR